MTAPDMTGNHIPWRQHLLRLGNELVRACEPRCPERVSSPVNLEEGNYHDKLMPSAKHSQDNMSIRSPTSVPGLGTFRPFGLETNIAVMLTDGEEEEPCRGGVGTEGRESVCPKTDAEGTQGKGASGRTSAMDQAAKKYRQVRFTHERPVSATISMFKLPITRPESDQQQRTPD